jgi:hypothetical protein
MIKYSSECIVTVKSFSDTTTHWHSDTGRYSITVKNRAYITLSTLLLRRATNGWSLFSPTRILLASCVSPLTVALRCLGYRSLNKVNKVYAFSTSSLFGCGVQRVHTFLYFNFSFTIENTYDALCHLSPPRYILHLHQLWLWQSFCWCLFQM